MEWRGRALFTRRGKCRRALRRQTAECEKTSRRLFHSRPSICAFHKNLSPVFSHPHTHSSTMVSVGDAVPAVTLESAPGETVDLAEIAGKGTGTTVLFAVPGAFTPTCSATHLPGFVAAVSQKKRVFVRGKWVFLKHHPPTPPTTPTGRQVQSRRRRPHPVHRPQRRLCHASVGGVD